MASRLSGEEKGGAGGLGGVESGMGTQGQPATAAGQGNWLQTGTGGTGGVSTARTGGSERWDGWDLVRGAGRPATGGRAGGGRTNVLQRASEPGRWVVARQNMLTWREWPHL
jgi:hypothetical protein